PTRGSIRLRYRLRCRCGSWRVSRDGNGIFRLSRVQIWWRTAWRRPLISMTAIFRFAPSPNGYLHLGHAYSALLNARVAAEAGGRLLLRIEDIDATRCRPEYEAAIFEDLRWLGLAWEEPVRRQSQHLGAYAEALERLAARGLIYPSFESRAEIATLVAARERDGPWPRDPDGAPLYPGTAKALPQK